MSEEQRKDRRVKIVSLNVRYKSASVDEFIDNHSHDVSSGGIFIKTASPFPQRTLLKLEVRIADDESVISGVGRVVWRREPDEAAPERPAGMGIKFIKLDDKSKAVIEKLIKVHPDAGGAFEQPHGSDHDLVAKVATAAHKASSPPAAADVDDPTAGMFPTHPALDEGGRREATVVRQTAELLEEALKEAGGSIEEIGANPLFDRDRGASGAASSTDAEVRLETLAGAVESSPSSTPAETTPRPKDTGAKSNKPPPQAPVADASESKSSPKVAPAPAREDDDAALPVHPLDRNKSSNFGLVLALVLLAAAGGGLYFMKDTVFGKSEPPPRPTATQSPPPVLPASTTPGAASASVARPAASPPAASASAPVPSTSASAPSAPPSASAPPRPRPAPPPPRPPPDDPYN